MLAQLRAPFTMTHFSTSGLDVGRGREGLPHVCDPLSCCFVPRINEMYPSMFPWRSSRDGTGGFTCGVDISTAGLATWIQALTRPTGVHTSTCSAEIIDADCWTGQCVWCLLVHVGCPSATLDVGPLQPLKPRAPRHHFSPKRNIPDKTGRRAG